MTVKSFSKSDVTRRFFTLLFRLWDAQKVDNISDIVTECGVGKVIIQKMIENKIISDKIDGFYHWIHESLPCFEMVQMLRKVKVTGGNGMSTVEDEIQEQSIDEILSQVSFEQLVEELKKRGDIKVFKRTVVEQEF